jgi:Xaa-Pro aminopeptidase
MTPELETKLAKIRHLLDERDLDALLIQRVSNFAWLTGGASAYVNTADELGASELLVTPDRYYVITNNIEAPRLRQEECLEQQGWVIRESAWHQAPEVLGGLVRGLRLGTDGLTPDGLDLNQDLSRLRMNLLPVERERFRQLAEGCADAMQVSIHQVKPGMTEYEIAGLLGKETQSHGILPVVNLVASDERVYTFRHPLPTAKTVERYAMLVLCGRKYGLVCSVTRLVHFGPIPAELNRKAQAVAEIDATLIASTRPGHALRDIFRQAQKKYDDLGFGDEWQHHHQGGPAGYVPREELATSSSNLVVAEGQAYAWNPSIAGAKSEDTILVGAQGNEILTEMHGWPGLSIQIGDQVIPRPAILEVD